jgi:hypothetical protein
VGKEELQKEKPPIIIKVQTKKIRGIYKKLKNIEIFNSVRISFDSIEWINHADIDPEFLYDKSEGYQA